MKKIVKLTENDLRKIIGKVINETIVKESIDPYSELNLALSSLGDVKISPFYSDNNSLTVSAPDYINPRDIIQVMRKFGYDFYDSGANGNRQMITFRDTDWHPQTN